MCDEWYMDDGQVVCPPLLFGLWLERFDLEIQSIGATRGSGPDVKSIARLVCPARRLNKFAEWDTPYVRDTCQVPPWKLSVTVRGAEMGSSQEIFSAADSVCKKVQAKR